MKHEPRYSPPTPAHPHPPSPHAPRQHPWRSLLTMVLLSLLSLLGAIALVRWAQQSIDPAHIRVVDRLHRQMQLSAADFDNQNAGSNAPSPVEFIPLETSPDGEASGAELPSFPETKPDTRESAAPLTKSEKPLRKPSPLTEIESALTPDGVLTMMSEPVGLAPWPGAVRLSGLRRVNGGFLEEVSAWEARGKVAQQVLDHYVRQAIAAKFKILRNRSGAGGHSSTSASDSAVSESSTNSVEVESVSRLLTRPLQHPAHPAALETLSIRVTADPQQNLTRVTIWLRAPLTPQP